MLTYMGQLIPPRIMESPDRTHPFRTSPEVIIFATPADMIRHLDHKICCFGDRAYIQPNCGARSATGTYRLSSGCCRGLRNRSGPPGCSSYWDNRWTEIIRASIAGPFYLVTPWPCPPIDMSAQGRRFVQDGKSKTYQCVNNNTVVFGIGPRDW